MTVSTLLTIDGNVDPNLRSKHALKVREPALKNGDAYAELVAVQEAIRNVFVTVVDNDGAALADPSLWVGWHYASIKEDRGYVPGETGIPDMPHAVRLLLPVASRGIQIDAQTVNGDPAFHIFIGGTYKGRPVKSDIGWFGAIDNHVTLHGVYRISIIGEQAPPANNPGNPNGSTERQSIAAMLHTAADRVLRIP